LISVSVVAAQGQQCGELVEQAITAVQDACADTGRNQACYGNVALEASAREGVTDFVFEQQGDLVDVADIDTLTLSSLDEVAGEWGVALLRIQANIPDTLPGQNVTFLLFGDVELQNAVDAADSADAGLTPMQAFYFRSGLDDSACAEAPSSGILIQTPEGAGTITLRANDVEISLGSTAYFQAEAGDAMTVSVVEGEAEVTADGETVVVPAGMQVGVPLDDELRASGVPEDPQPYDAAAFTALPISVLPEEITIAGASTTAAPGMDITSLMGGDFSAFGGMDPTTICGLIQQALADAGMTMEQYVAFIQQVGGTLSGEATAGLQTFLAMIQACG
jgi:hypothetical protein